MSYWHPTQMHPALLAHHEELAHRLVTDPVNVAPGGAVAPLQYHNGPTILTPRVFNLYAGTPQDDPAVISAFTGRIVENGYLSAAKGQGTGPGTFGGGFTIAPPPGSSITDADCRAMLAAAIGQHGIPAPDANSLYLLFLPDGCQVAFTAGGDASCSRFCGYHSNDVLGGAPLYYTVQPATTCQGCYQTSPRIGLQMVIAHEIVEAATDPTGQGWFNDQTGEEGGDEAAWVQDQYGQDITQGYAAQNAAGLWVNSIGAYVAPTPPPGSHFVPSGPAAAAWQQLLAGGPLAAAEIELLLLSDPRGPAAPAWRWLLNHADGAQALLDAGWGRYFASEGAA